MIMRSTTLVLPSGAMVALPVCWAADRGLDSEFAAHLIPQPKLWICLLLSSCRGNVESL